MAGTSVPEYMTPRSAPQILAPSSTPQILAPTSGAQGNAITVSALPRIENTYCHVPSYSSSCAPNDVRWDGAVSGDVLIWIQCASITRAPCRVVRRVCAGLLPAGMVSHNQGLIPSSSVTSLLGADYVRATW